VVRPRLPRAHHFGSERVPQVATGCAPHRADFALELA
jgi:hypothetical protein